jgi:hypothetical protein
MICAFQQFSAGEDKNLANVCNPEVHRDLRRTCGAAETKRPAAMNSNLLMPLASILLLLPAVCGGCRQQNAAPADQPEFTLEVENTKAGGVCLVVTDRGKCVFRHRIDGYWEFSNIWDGSVTMIDFDQDRQPEFVTCIYAGGNSFHHCYVVGRHNGEWTVWADGISCGLGAAPSFADTNADGNLDIIAPASPRRSRPNTHLFSRTAEGQPTFVLEKSPNGDPPAPLAKPTVKPEIRLSPEKIRDVFIAGRNVTRFAKPRHIYTAVVSPDDRYLMVWHMQAPPRTVSIYDLQNKREVSTFSPGFGGSLSWAAGNLLYHQWGAGTNTAIFAIFSLDGKKQWGGSSSGADLCETGRYVFSFPTTGVAIEEIKAMDIRNGRTLAGIRPSGISSVMDHIWVDGRTVVFRYSDINHAIKVVDITVDSGDPPASLAPETSSNPALERVWETELARGLRRKHPNTIIYVEGHEADGVHVYLGFNEGTHTTRHSSLCVRSDGTVWREFTRPDLELEWRPVK